MRKEVEFCKMEVGLISFKEIGSGISLNNPPLSRIVAELR